jgi:Ribbon-helix-helix protein, copG family
VGSNPTLSASVVMDGGCPSSPPALAVHLPRDQEDMGVYNLYTVQRTQVYLDERQVAKLRATARATHRTLSEIVREAIDEKLARPDDSEPFEIALAQAAGIWANRDDLGSTDDYVRRLRQDRRGSTAR